jgi:hypothetical protein
VNRRGDTQVHRNLNSADDVPIYGRRHSRRALQLAYWLTAPMLSVVAGACGAMPTGASNNPAAELVVPVPPDDREVLAAAWTVDLHRVEGRVVVTPPSRIGPIARYPFILTGETMVEGLAGSAVWSVPGARRPGLLHVGATLRVYNGSTVASLGHPADGAFPDATGPLMIPVDVQAPASSGGVTTAAEWVRIELPNRGVAAPSTVWKGEPRAYFGPGSCSGRGNRCYRSQSLARPLEPSTSDAIVVGFDAEETVSHIRFRVILAGRPTF